jgi:hypothetical protein
MRIYLAGMEQRETLDVVKAKLVKSAFVSYYYMRKHSKNYMNIIRENIKNIIVDSGAHTFFSEMTNAGLSVSVHKKKTKTKETPEEYFSKYKEWLIQNKEYYDYFVELDIGEIVGQKRVLEWREELKKLGLYKKCITVYHPDIMSKVDYISTLEDSESKYVALEGDRPQHRKRLAYLSLIREGYKRGIKIHGFAMTKENVYFEFPFYSVDSTSWKAGVIFGIGKCITNKGKITNIKFTDKKSFYKIKGASINLHNKNLAITRFERYSLSIKAYERIEKEVTNIWQIRGIKW